MNARLLLCLLWLPTALLGQGFAGLGTTPEGFSTPAPDPDFVFPADHGAHPDYRIEWWYLTANLTAEDGTLYGLQWTLFRSALAPEAGTGWTAPQIWMGHAAVTTPTDHFVSERFARGGVGQAGVTADPFEAWIDEWSLTGDWMGQMNMTASGHDFSYDMELTNTGPLVRQGVNGYSVKSAGGQASYYYSAPFLDISGILDLRDGPIAVSGNAWIDREWSSQPLSDDQSGWDWFSLSFDDGAKMMGFRLRQTDNTYFTSATWITAEGDATPYGDGSFSATPLAFSDADIPIEWNLQLPERGVDVKATALNDDAWMDVSVPYWEGPITLEGSHNGIGYLEMTGYE